MKHFKKIGLGIIIAATISSCNGIAAKDYSKDRKGNSSEKNMMVDNSSLNIKVSNLPNDSLEINSKEPLVCLLTGKEQFERKKILQKKIFSQVKKVKEVETGYIFYFKYHFVSYYYRTFIF